MGESGVLNAKKYYRNLGKTMDWVYKNIDNLGIGPNVAKDIKKAMPAILNTVDFAADFFTRIFIFLSAARKIYPKLEEGVAIERLDKASKKGGVLNFDKYKDSITLDGDTLKVERKSNAWKDNYDKDYKPKNSLDSFRQEVNNIELIPLDSLIKIKQKSR